MAPASADKNGKWQIAGKELKIVQVFFMLLFFIPLVLSGCFNPQMIEQANEQMQKLDERVTAHNELIANEMEENFGDDLEEAKKEIKDKVKQTAYDLTEKGFKFIAETMTNESKIRIDAWLAERGLNEYGDEQGVVYTGGTPLFDETTGEEIDRYEYILEQHPELVEELELEN